VRLCVGARVNGTAARPKTQSGPESDHASLDDDRQADHSSECVRQSNPSVNRYRSGAFHRMVPAASPRKVPLANTAKTRRMALAFLPPSGLLLVLPMKEPRRV